MQQVEDVLKQDRSVVDFRHYTPSPEHVERMKSLKCNFPDLYGNPSVSSRRQWFNHPNWYNTPQMPTFHVHFREEMQAVVRNLYEAYESSKNNAGGLTIQTVLSIQDADSNFTSCMKISYP